MGAAIPIAALALTAAGTGAAVYGQVEASNLQQDAARANSKRAKQAAADARRRGDVDVTKYRLNLGKLKGRQRAAIASGGAVVGEGTTGRILEDTAAMAELDVLTIQNNAAREAYGLEGRSESFGLQSDLYQVAGGVGAAGSLITGVARGIQLGRQLNTGLEPSSTSPSREMFGSPF